MEVVVIDKATFERMLSGFENFAKRWNGSAGNMGIWERGNGLTAMTCAGCSVSVREPYRRCGRMGRWLTPR